MKKNIVFCTVLLAGLVGLTACDGNGGSPKEKTGNLDGDYTVGNIQVDGKPLRCVTMKRGVGDASWGGISCNWEEFNGTRTP